MAIAEILKRLGLAKKSPPTALDQMSSALHASVTSILKDASAEDRAELLDTTLDQYREAVLDAAMTDSVFKAAKKPFMSDDEGEEDEPDDESGECEKCGASVRKGSACKKCGTVMKLQTGDEMDKLEKQAYEDRIAELEALVKASPVSKAFTALQEEVTALRKKDEIRTNIEKATELLGDGASIDEITATAEVIASGGNTDLIAKLAKQRATFAKAAMLTVAVGADVGSDATSPNAILAKAAEAIMAADPKLTPEQAISKALDANPNLYAQSLR